MPDSNNQGPGSISRGRAQVPATLPWRQSTASLCSSSASHRSGGNLHQRLRRNVHLMKGSNSRITLCQQLLEHHANDGGSNDHRHRRFLNSSVLATFQARLCLGTEYLPVYELSLGGTAASSSSSSSSSLQPQQNEVISTFKRRKLDTLERIVKQTKEKKKAIKRLTFLRLTSRGIVFSDVPSIKLGSGGDDLADICSPACPSSSITSSPKSTTTNTSTVQRTPSVQKATIAWADLDHISLDKRRLNLHLKPKPQLMSPVKAGQQESSVMHLKFATIRDVHAFITAGLAYGYFFSKDLVFSTSSGVNDVNADSSSMQPCTSSTSNTAVATATAKELAFVHPTKKRNLLATLWAKLKSSSSPKGKADISTNNSSSSSSSTSSSSADVSSGAPDSTTDQKGSKDKSMQGSSLLRRHFSTSVRWASQTLQLGRLCRRRR